jgi:hypothetical protein
MENVNGNNTFSTLEETNLFRMAVKKFEPTGKFSTYAIESAIDLIAQAKRVSKESGLMGEQYYKSMENFIKDYVVEHDPM